MNWKWPSWWIFCGFSIEFQILKKFKQDAERRNPRGIGKAIAILCTVRSTIPEHQPDSLLHAIIHRFLSMPKITWKGLRAMLLFPESVPQHLSKRLGWKMARANGQWQFPRWNLNRNNNNKKKKVKLTYTYTYNFKLNQNIFVQANVNSSWWHDDVFVVSRKLRLKGRNKPNKKHTKTYELLILPRIAVMIFWFQQNMVIFFSWLTF